MADSHDRLPTWLIVVLSLQALQAVFPIVALVLLALEDSIPVESEDVITMVAPLAIVALAAATCLQLWRRGRRLASKLIAFFPAMLGLAIFVILETG